MVEDTPTAFARAVAESGRSIFFVKKQKRLCEERRIYGIDGDVFGHRPAERQTGLREDGGPAVLDA